MVSAASQRRTHTNEKWVSFDIENDTNGGLKYSNTTDFVDRNRKVLASNKSPIVVVDILKTLFLYLFCSWHEQASEVTRNLHSRHL
ncbi:hypothetical protein HanRHA438_Chr03g0118181 [Helianthus annuus]|nr:hypothetical protein HanRHA438_Chr03g0118181 [Helianthus annuus]